MLRKITAVHVFRPPAPICDGFDDDGSQEPIVEWGDPADLYVDDEYQRPLTAKGLSLIRRVAGGTFSWRKFKLPSVTKDAEGRRVILDGQHTATMALTRGVRRIPWLLVGSDGKAEEAEAFVAHNRDRTAVSLLEAHKASVVAGDPDAVAIERVCEQTGVRIIPSSGNPSHAIGETFALVSIKRLVNKRGMEGARKVLKILFDANLAPIGMNHIKAVEELMFGDEPAKPSAAKLSELLMGRSGVELVQESERIAAETGIRPWRCLVTVLRNAANAG